MFNGQRVHDHPPNYTVKIKAIKKVQTVIVMVDVKHNSSLKPLQL